MGSLRSATVSTSHCAADAAQAPDSVIDVDPTGRLDSVVQAAGGRLVALGAGQSPTCADGACTLIGA